MALNKYDVVIDGVETTLLLSDEDAKLQGLKPVGKVKVEPEEKAKTPANKAKTPANKRAGAASKAFGNKGDG